MRDYAPAEQQPANRRRTTPWLALLASVIVLAVVIGIAVGAIFIFRGGGPDSDLKEYFESVAALVNDIDDRSGEGFVRAPGDILIQWAIVLRDTATKLDAIEPPPEAADAHAELVAGIDEGGVILANFPDQHSAVATVDEARRLLSEDEGLLAADERASGACAELQKLAEENEIEVEMDLC